MLPVAPAKSASPPERGDEQLDCAVIIVDEQRCAVAGPGHLSVGQDDLARDHLDRGRASVEALGNDGYGQMIKDGLDRLADRLA